MAAKADDDSAVMGKTGRWNSACPPSSSWTLRASCPCRDKYSTAPPLPPPYLFSSRLQNDDRCTEVDEEAVLRCEGEACVLARPRHSSLLPLRLSSIDTSSSPPLRHSRTTHPLPRPPPPTPAAHTAAPCSFLLAAPSRLPCALSCSPALPIFFALLSSVLARHMRCTPPLSTTTPP